MEPVTESRQEEGVVSATVELREASWLPRGRGCSLTCDLDLRNFRHLRHQHPGNCSTRLTAETLRLVLLGAVFPGSPCSHRVRLVTQRKDRTPPVM